jgi:hypothetical protein
VTLLTYCDAATGERTELSAAELGRGDRVLIPDLDARAAAEGATEIF